MSGRPNRREGRWFYTYDANGNITKDSNKGISNIKYNLLNLPEEVAFTNGNSIKFFYSAEGEKLRAVHTTGGTTTQVDYCGNIVYEAGIQKYLLNDEGYYDLGNGGYHYYLKDHLGNNRVVINQSGAVQQTNHYYPYGGTFAYTSTAANNQPYKYNGKEFDTHAGLNWYDYGARHYDPAIARWTTQDPLAEKYYSLTPYGYCAGNPIMYMEPDGRRSWPVKSKYKGYERSYLNNFGEAKGKRLHKGLDINFKSAGNNDLGAPILATHDGVISRIVRIEEGDKNAGGNRVLITSMDGAISTYYMHLNDINPDLKENDPVQEGDIIGTMGGSGNGKESEYAVHLHYELKINGHNINPVIDDTNLIDPQLYITGADGGMLNTITIVADAPSYKKLPLVKIK